MNRRVIGCQLPSNVDIASHSISHNLQGLRNLESLGLGLEAVQVSAGEPASPFANEGTLAGR